MSAFSNGFEFESWAKNWCQRCTKDVMGLGTEDTNCSILDQAMLTVDVPEQWTPGNDDLRDRYHCAEFEGK